VRKIFRDPFSGLSHLVGAAVGIWGVIDLGRRAGQRLPPLEASAFVVFGVSGVLMYSVSALYHLLHLSDAKRVILRRVDHTMIFLLIAGTYTPFCLLPLRATYGIPILATVWGVAIGGLLVKLFWLHAPRWLSTGIYIGMGWIGITAIFPLINELTGPGLTGLIGGGVLYTGGAVIYAIKRPDPFPPHFGFHEIWHLFVLAGTASHYYSVSTLIPK
jgi:hemolysin III